VADKGDEEAGILSWILYVSRRVDVLTGMLQLAAMPFTWWVAELRSVVKVVCEAKFKNPEEEA